VSVPDGALITAEGLRLRAMGTQPIHLAIRPGERVGLLGATGSGRGRLLRALARLEPPAAGRIRWDGADVTHRPRWLMRRAQREGVILIWENPYVLFEQNLTVRQIVGRGDRLAQAGLSPVALDLPVKALSGLARVRLALAYAAQREPRVLLVDDVFHHLVPAVWSEVVARFDQFAAAGAALVVASRYPSVLQSMQRVVVMSNGDIVERGLGSGVGLSGRLSQHNEL
jgi:ABC-type glutathione transport system ATPase component